MATICDLIFPWPVAVELVSHTTLADFLNLSRVDTRCRAILHGFAEPSPPDDGQMREDVRADIYIGQHQTTYWKHLKSTAQLLCSEPNHTKGQKPNLCRYCSMPVCEACIVKESFGKSESTYRLRYRYLCSPCWSDGNPHRGRRFKSSPALKTPYNFAPGMGDFCVCTVKDGWICLACKTAQNEEAKNLKTCIGEGCTNELEEDRERRRICMWCDRPMLGPGRPKAGSRAEYEKRHVHARSDRAFEEQGPRREGEYLKRRQNTKPLSRKDLAELRGGGEYIHVPPFLFEGYSDEPKERNYIRHFTVVNYDSIGIAPPSRLRTFDSVWGNYRYDMDFLMQFQAFCIKEPTPDWSKMLVEIMVDEDAVCEDEMVGFRYVEAQASSSRRRDRRTYAERAAKLAEDEKGKMTDHDHDMKDDL